MKAKQLSHTEKIIHKTGSSPFSLHFTEVPFGQSSALYLHCHSEAEFFLLESGTLDFEAESGHYTLQPGDGIFIPPGMLHQALRTDTGEASCRYFAIVFSTEPLARCFPTGSPYFEALTCRRQDCVFPLFAACPEHAQLLSYIRDILRFREAEPCSCELYLQGLLFVCWQELYNLHLSKITASSEDTALRRDLLRSLDYLQAHYADPLSLSQLAQSAGYSESYYCRSFRHYTDSTPFEYLNRIRIVKSCELLSSTDKKVTEIASLVGFNNISYFNRMFMKIMGVTPKAYRRS